MTACGHVAPQDRDGASARASVSINGLSAAQVIDDFRKADLPARNPQEITSVKCRDLPCLQAVTTDSVTVLKFPGTGPAQRYIGSRSDMFQIEDLVLEFAPQLSDEARHRYEQVVERAAA